MSRRLRDLHPLFRPFAVDFVARTVEERIPVVIVDTMRTEAEHAANLAAGTSWVKRSKHMDGAAIDIAPYAVWNLDGADKIEWDANNPVWQRLGVIGEDLGLVWGGRWQKRDMGHFEAPEWLYNLIIEDRGRRHA